MVRRSLRSIFCSLALLLLIAAAPTTAPSTTAPSTTPSTTPAPRTPFTTVVARDFDQWDTNDDHVLGADEIDTLVLDPSIKGDDAAAVAALKIVLRGGKFTLPPITLEYFVDYEQAVAARKKPSPNWDGYYRSSKRRIALGGELHWPEKGLSLKNMRQGPLGDCYLVAVVGAMVERDSSQLHAMVSELPDNRYQIAFPATQPIVVGPLTDVQIAISSTTAGDGVWLALFEQAFGRLRASLAGKGEVAEATDLIARGGSTTATIAALTGHGRQVVYFPRNRDKDEEKQIARIRDAVVKGLNQRRIVTASVAALPTTSATNNPATNPANVADAPATQPTIAPTTQSSRSPRIVPPGIDTKHAYAILSYDADTDSIDLWNPHGQTFKPKGDAGLKFGYPTANGRFRVPMREAYRFLSLITIESDSPPTTRPTSRASSG
jgi:hypothetical protein